MHCILFPIIFLFTSLSHPMEMPRVDKNNSHCGYSLVIIVSYFCTLGCSCRNDEKRKEINWNKGIILVLVKKYNESET